MGCRPPAPPRLRRAGKRPTRAPIGNRTLDLFLTMETLCRLSYWGTADPAKASRERPQVDLLCDGETTRSAARIRNRPRSLRRPRSTGPRLAGSGHERVAAARRAAARAARAASRGGATGGARSAPRADPRDRRARPLRPAERVAGGV